MIPVIFVASSCRLSPILLLIATLCLLLKLGVRTASAQDDEEKFPQAQQSTPYEWASFFSVNPAVASDTAASSSAGPEPSLNSSYTVLLHVHSRNLTMTMREISTYSYVNVEVDVMRPNGTDHFIVPDKMRYFKSNTLDLFCIFTV